MLFRPFQHVFLHLVKHFGKLWFDLVKRNKNLFSRIAAHNHCLVLFDIFRSDLDSGWDSLNFLFTELPSRTLVGIVYFYFIIFRKALSDLFCFFENSFFFLHDRHDHRLYRCDFRRQHESWIVAVDHNDRPDNTCGHAPWCLMDILQFVVLIGILDIKRFSKSIPEVMACPWLKSFSVMHQCFDRISGIGPCKLFFLRLLSFDNRNCQVLLAEVRIHI